jgi:hypothetical protein
MRDQRAFRAVVVGCALVALLGACGSTSDPTDPTDPTMDPTDPTDPTIPEEFVVHLVTTATGTQRINFAVPLSAGTQSDANLRIVAGTTELASARRVLATYADGSARSIQVQADVDVDTYQTLSIQLHTASPTLDLVPVAQTLAGTGNNVAPKVFVLLPTEVLTASSIAGPVAPRSAMVGTPLDAWSQLCDYAAWDTDAFLVNAAASRDVWLFDRVTAMYRGYAITGDVVPLRSAYREATIYQAGMTISNGVATNIAVPGAQTDLKYYYAQGMALHYLLTGDDRFREAAEAVSAKVATMWDPNYDGTDEFWTERHAGFALLAHEWAAIVSDDKAPAIAARADAAVTAFLAAQMAPRYGQTDNEARCFAHTATAHGEDWGGNGCSPWMSAILADALDAHARRVGGDRAVAVRAALARLGRAIVKDGRDSTGRPLYWMGVGTSADQVDEYDEHWGESAYIVALAWNATGRTDAALKTAADSLVLGVRDRGEVGQVRSFNWQCRSSVMAPALLR